jgi:hypothetical protein
VLLPRPPTCRRFLTSYISGGRHGPDSTSSSSPSPAASHPVLPTYCARRQAAAPPSPTCCATSVVDLASLPQILLGSGSHLLHWLKSPPPARFPTPTAVRVLTWIPAGAGLDCPVSPPGPGRIYALLKFRPRRPCLHAAQFPSSGLCVMVSPLQ